MVKIMLTVLCPSSIFLFSTAASLGFGFVTFEKEESVAEVCKLQYVIIKDKQVSCPPVVSSFGVLFQHCNIAFFTPFPNYRCVSETACAPHLPFSRHHNSELFVLS